MGTTCKQVPVLIHYSFIVWVWFLQGCHLQCENLWFLPLPIFLGFFLTLSFSLSLITDQIYLSFPYLNSSSPHFILSHYYYTSSKSLSSSHLYPDYYFYSPIHIDQISHSYFNANISSCSFTPFRSIPPSYFFSILLIRLIPLLLFPPTLTFLCCQDNSLSQLF